jgi:hypothetical protein
LPVNFADRLLWAPSFTKGSPVYETQGIFSRMR